MFVPQLRIKLKLLGRHGPRWRRADIAARLGVVVSTIESWADGNLKRNVDPDRVPDKHMDALVALFTEALPGKHTREEVAALLTGSVAALERALTADTAPSIEDIIAAEARTGTAKLVRPPSLGLVEHVADDDDLPAVRLGEAFLIEYRTARRGFLFVLQHDAQQAWGAVLFASGEASLRHDAGPVLIPGIKDKRFVPIRERSHPGIHRFMLFVAPEPFPAGITKPARARTYFDWQTLGDLAAHFARQPKHLRELHLLTIRVEGGQDQSR